MENSLANTPPPVKRAPLPVQNYLLRPSNVPGAYHAIPESGKFCRDVLKRFLLDGKEIGRSAITANPVKAGERQDESIGETELLLPRLELPGMDKKLPLAFRRKGPDINNDWAGIVTKTYESPVSTIQGYWSAPLIKIPSPPLLPGQTPLTPPLGASAWIGLGDAQNGYNDILQAGISMDLDKQSNLEFLYYTCWFQWYCNFQRVRLSEYETFTTPAVAQFQNFLVLAWTRGGYIQVASMSSYGLTNLGYYLSAETSPAPVSLCYHNNQLNIGWTGDDRHLNIAEVLINGNGVIVGFGPKQTIRDEQSSTGTVLASMDDKLFVCWTGVGNDRINLMYRSDGQSNFGSKYISPAATTTKYTPSLTVHKEALYAAWRDSITGQLVLCKIYQINLVSWVTLQMDEVASQGVAIASVSDILYAGWRADDGTLCTKQYDEILPGFDRKYISAQTSALPPSLGTIGAYIFVSWQDTYGTLSLSVVGLNGDIVENYEMDKDAAQKYSINPVVLNLPVKVGDAIECELSFNTDATGSHFTSASLSFFNKTAKKMVNMCFLPSPGTKFSGDTAEWILETVVSGQGETAQWRLPAFDPVKFTNAFATGIGNGVAYPQIGDIVNINNGQDALTKVDKGEFDLTITYVD